MSKEQERLQAAREKSAPWKKWGPYLSERQWGTVREDYSDNGDAWNYFTHDQARSRAYHWGEDGLGGVCDDHQILCFALDNILTVIAPSPPLSEIGFGIEILKVVRFFIGRGQIVELVAHNISGIGLEYNSRNT